MSALIQVDDQSFDSTVRVPGRVLVDFTAERCAPCRALLPIVTRIAATSGPALRVVKVDVDDCPDLAVRFRVRGIPTLVVLEDGREVARHLGSASESKVRELIAREIEDDRASL